MQRNFMITILLHMRIINGNYKSDNTTYDDNGYNDICVHMCFQTYICTP